MPDGRARRPPRTVPASLPPEARQSVKPGFTARGPEPGEPFPGAQRLMAPLRVGAE